MLTKQKCLKLLFSWWRHIMVSGSFACLSLGWEVPLNKIRNHFSSISPFPHQLLSLTTHFPSTVVPCSGFMIGSLHPCRPSASLASSSWLPSEKWGQNSELWQGWHCDVAVTFLVSIHPIVGKYEGLGKFPWWLDAWIFNAIRLAHSSIIAIVLARSIFRLRMRMGNSCPQFCEVPESKTHATP